MTYDCDEKDCPFCDGSRCRACESAAVPTACDHLTDPTIRHEGISVSRTRSDTPTAKTLPLVITSAIAMIEDPQGVIEFLRETIRVIETKMRIADGAPIKLTITID